MLLLLPELVLPAHSTVKCEEAELWKKSAVCTTHPTGSTDRETVVEEAEPRSSSRSVSYYGQLDRFNYRCKIYFWSLSLCVVQMDSQGIPIPLMVAAGGGGIAAIGRFSPRPADLSLVQGKGFNSFLSRPGMSGQGSYKGAGKNPVFSLFCVSPEYLIRQMEWDVTPWLAPLLCAAKIFCINDEGECAFI